MKFSEHWLRDWVDPPVDTETLGNQLTFMGLEVDEIVSAAPDFAGVVVARIVDTVQHPDADRLRVCTVDCGQEETLQVVCGAPNARAGLTTALAQVGGQLPDGTKLKKAKLRGVVSMGMLCSASELQLSEEADGIMELPEEAPPGTSLLEWLELDDSIIEIELTPDRGDCLSIRGVARDLCARNNLPMKLHEITPMALHIDEQWPVKVAEDCACVRFTGRVIRDIDISAATPAWMVERLRRSDIRSINSAVDITNYVMLELGQPMHAFDLDKLQGAIQVRLAKAGEKLVLLDGREVVLDEDTTVIADDRGAISIAGIIGGEGTGVSETTRNIFFEAALFLPELIAGKPRRYSSHTESAHRFERGVDPAGQVEALEYATGLLLNTAGGKTGPAMDWQSTERMPQRREVRVRDARLQRVLGISPASETVQTIFTRLGIDSTVTDDGWQVMAPSYRYDLDIEEDYIEEVARILGFDTLPRTSPSNTPIFKALSESTLTPIDVKKRLVALGYQEIITYSFVEAGQQQVLRPDLHALPLANPLSSEMGVMRTTLVSGLISSSKRNTSRQVGTMRLFETGLRSLANTEQVPVDQLDDYILPSFGAGEQIDESVHQQEMMAGLIAGRIDPENWNADNREVDFYTLKADIENLFAQANGQPVRFVDSDLSMLHPGQQAGIEIDGQRVGYLGALNPGILRQLDIDLATLVFELPMAAVCFSRVPKASPLSRFPQVRRDLALLVDESISYQQLLDVVRKAVPKTLIDVKVFDVYHGGNLEKGKKSIALGLILQDFSRTLEDRDIDKVVVQVTKALDNSLGAVLRI
ncbi:phenylalanine--tRNA ligase subunit beta [Granulosicoccus sp.]|nr:phenylalanine--tRNA ligase subunit beta [Granulosicoccus sp.]